MTIPQDLGYENQIVVKDLGFRQYKIKIFNSQLHLFVSGYTSSDGLVSI